jgi:hypothetical protein
VPPIGGYFFLENWRLDARRAAIFWRPELVAGALRIVPAPPGRARAQRPFDLWSLAGRKALGLTPEGLFLHVQTRQFDHHLWAPEGIAGDQPFILEIDPTPDSREQLRAADHFLHPPTTPGNASGDVTAHPQSLKLARYLQALDGHLAGASPREIAGVLFGAARVGREWVASDNLRKMTSYSIARGRALMHGEYLRLLNPATPSKD